MLNWICDLKAHLFPSCFPRHLRLPPGLNSSYLLQELNRTASLGFHGGLLGKEGGPGGHKNTHDKRRCGKGTIWVFPKIGVPQNRWFIMENPHTCKIPVSFFCNVLCLLKTFACHDASLMTAESVLSHPCSADSVSAKIHLSRKMSEGGNESCLGTNEPLYRQQLQQLQP